MNKKQALRIVKELRSPHLRPGSQCNLPDDDRKLSKQAVGLWNLPFSTDDSTFFDHGSGRCINKTCPRHHSRWAFLGAAEILESLAYSHNGSIDLDLD